MEPQLPSPSSSPEKAPVRFGARETFSGGNEPEKAPEQAERQESREQHVGGPSGDPATTTPVAPPLPQLPSTPAAPAAGPAIDDTNPASASDEDLIEKEWVEKAKKVVAETKHDPYLQGREVSRLQADYLKKRYGKLVNLPSDGA